MKFTIEKSDFLRSYIRAFFRTVTCKLADRGSAPNFGAKKCEYAKYPPTLMATAGTAASAISHQRRLRGFAPIGPLGFCEPDGPLGPCGLAGSASPARFVGVFACVWFLFGAFLGAILGAFSGAHIGCDCFDCCDCSGTPD